MRVGNVDINLGHLVDQIKARKMPKRIRTPNCTHLVMDRIYDRDEQCDICGRPPLIGFLYECRQDWNLPTLHDMSMEENEGHAATVKSTLRLNLEGLGLSQSVIRAAEQGHYTDAQIEKIKAQKKDLRDIISDSLQASQINDAAAKLAAIAQEPPNNDGALNSTARDDTGPMACTLKCCHNCRPYYRDRVYISFQSVLDGDFPPMVSEDIENLPTKSVQIMQTIGTTTSSLSSIASTETTPHSLPTLNSLATSDVPPTASTSTSTSTDLTSKTTQTDIDFISSQRRPRRRFYKMGPRASGDIAHDLSRQRSRLVRQGLRSALQGIFRSNRESSSSGSNITLPVPRTGTVRNSSEVQNVGDFDLPALRKVRKEKERMEAEEGEHAMRFENVSPAMDSVVHTPKVTSETGSEVEVDGGVALTEDAVETRTPDMLATDLFAFKNAAVVRNVEIGQDYDDDATDLGLQSIVAQV